MTGLVVLCQRAYKHGLPTVYLESHRPVGFHFNLDLAHLIPLISTAELDL